MVVVVVGVGVGLATAEAFFSTAGFRVKLLIATAHATFSSHLLPTL